jgi:hypothetical protein
MNSHALRPTVDREPARAIANRDPARPIDAARLAAANINPRTGLATDYLNHFNEAIMMLEMLPTMPECVEDLLQWRVMSYREHFLATHQKHRDLVLAAYETAEPHARYLLDECTDTMDVILTAAREALYLHLSQGVAGALAQEAAAQLRPLVARAGAIINGLMMAGDEQAAAVPQATVDALLER